MAKGPSFLPARVNINWYNLRKALNKFVNK